VVYVPETLKTDKRTERVEQPTKLLNRNYFLLWLGQFVSSLGSQMIVVAMVFWIKRTTGSATLLGLMQMMSSLPAVILGPVGGTFADRYSRRRIIVLSDLLRGAALFSLAALMFLLPNATDLILVWLLVVAVFSSVVASFFGPAISASIPDLVPKDKVVSANSLGQLSLQLSLFFGQGLGGTLFRLLGAPVLILINSLTFWFAAASDSFVAIPQSISPRSLNWREQFLGFKEETGDGLRYVWHKAGLRELVFISAFLVFFTTPIIILLPFYVEDVLRVGADWYGYILAISGVGSLAGYLLAGLLKLRGRLRASWMVTFIIVESVGYGLLGLVGNPFIALIMAFLGGVTGGFVTVNITTILQLTTPNEVRGRVFGLLSTISGSLAPIAMGLAGVVADLVNQNVTLIYLACGAAMTGLSVAVLLNREVRSFLAYESEGPPPPKKQAVPLKPATGSD
jgi:MFS family permease